MRNPATSLLLAVPSYDHRFSTLASGRIMTVLALERDREHSISDQSVALNVEFMRGYNHKPE